MYITLSETAEELRAVADSHGWSNDKLHIYEQLVGEEQLGEEDSTVFYPAEIAILLASQMTDGDGKLDNEHAPHRAPVAPSHTARQ